jgi:hypothetical protein
MPWLPELFSAPVLWEDARRRRMALVPFFVGVLTGETSALVDSFAGEPELHHYRPPVGPDPPAAQSHDRCPGDRRLPNHSYAVAALVVGRACWLRPACHG